MLGDEEDVESLAESIVGRGAAPGKRMMGMETSLEEGDVSEPSEEDDAGVAAAEEALAAFQGNDAVALDKALRNHYAICAGK